MPVCKCKTAGCGSTPTGKSISFRLWKSHQRQDIVSDLRNSDDQTASLSSSSMNPLFKEDRRSIPSQSILTIASVPKSKAPGPAPPSALQSTILDPIPSRGDLHSITMGRSIADNRGQSISKHNEKTSPHLDPADPRNDPVYPSYTTKTSLTNGALSVNKANPVIISNTRNVILSRSASKSVIPYQHMSDHFHVEPSFPLSTPNVDFRRSATEEAVGSLQLLATVDLELKESRPVLTQLYDMVLEEFHHAFKKHEERLLSCQKTLRKYHFPTAISYRVSPLLAEIENQLSALSQCRNKRLYNINYHSTSSHFHRPLEKCDPALVASLVSAAIPYLLGGLSRKFANMHLRGNRLILDLASKTGNEDILSLHPSDIRTVRKLLQLDPVLHMYACCPSCSFIHPPEMVPIKSLRNAPPSFRRKYPSVCAYCPFPADPNARPCEAKLLKESRASLDDIPLRPYMFQHPKDFLARFLARRDIELLMDQAWSTNIEAEYLTDIFQTEVCQTFMGPDGLTFRAAANIKREGRYLFALFVDWFNPYSNKAAGPIASFGTISMVCLNLPLSIRYKKENIYLVGLIPGPQEPSMEEADHFLQPLIDSFEELWNPGLYLERTGFFRTGKKIIAAILPLIGDMKALRKISGNAQCQICHLPQESVKKGILYKDFPLPLADIEYRTLAEKWLNASDRSTREKVYRENGIRWTPFLRLPYWRPSSFVIVDAMHALFLGVIPTHFRHIYRMDGVQADIMEKASKIVKSKKSRAFPLDEDNVRRGEELMNSGNVSLAALSRLRQATLKHLCSVYLPSVSLQANVTTNTMVNWLFEWHRTRISPVSQPVVPEARNPPLQTREDLINSTNKDGESSTSIFSKGLDAENYELAEKELLEKATITKSTLMRYRFATLYALSEVYLPEKLDEEKRYTKAVLSDLLCTWRQNQPNGTLKRVPRAELNVNIPEPVSLTLPSGEEDIPSSVIFDGKTLLAIRDDIRHITVPTWVAPLTPQFGSKRKGKLKADAWRNAATIYLPITLVRIWGSKDSSEITKKYLINTMHLISAVILITSLEVTSTNASLYTEYMENYLQGLRELFPNLQFRDNHHVSLHLEYFVKLFGPVQCWWTFPFERVIGVLERYNTNWKMGEMEQTIMSSFCAAANLHTFLNLDFTSFPALQSTLENLKKSLMQDSEDSLFDGNDTLDSVADRTHGRASSLPKPVYQALNDYLGSNANTLSTSGQLYKSIIHRGLRYSTRTAAPRDSFIMVKSTKKHNGWPAQIEFIFTHDELPLKKHFYACVRRFADTQLEFDPYAAFPVLQARIYSNVLNKHEIIDFNDVWCHFAHNRFDENNIVALPLDRVHPMEFQLIDESQN